MKKILVIAIIGTSMLLLGCRKKVLRDVDEAGSLGATHCLNGQFDADELGTDCGGVDCDTCTTNAAPCTNSANTLYIHTGFVYDTKSITSTSIDTSGNWTFSAYTDGSTLDYLYFVFPGKPNVITTYNGVAQGSILDPNEVKITYYDYNNGDKIGSGQVYVTYENGAYTIASCDYSFHGWGQSTPPGTQWFNVTF